MAVPDPACRGARGGAPRAASLALLLALGTLGTLGLESGVRGADPEIREFLASASGRPAEGEPLLDEDGDSSDWIEIHNPGPDAARLDGWWLTDHPHLVLPWRLPDVTIEPGERLVVFASGKDRAGPELHTSFRLDADGEYLALVRPDGLTVVSEFGVGGEPFPPQYQDMSYGVRRSLEVRALVEPFAPCRVRVPDASDGGAWRGGEEPFDDLDWVEGATGVGFDTTDPPEPEAGLPITSGLVLWLDATHGVATDADGRVVEWSDRTVGDNSAADPARQSAPAHRPLLVEDGSGSPEGDRPVIRFDGSQTDESLATWLDVAHAADLVPGEGGWTVFVVGRQTNTTGFWLGKGNRASSDDGYSIWSQSDVLHVRAGTGEGTDPERRGSQNTVRRTVMTIVTLEITGGEIFGFLDGENAGWLDGGGGGQGRSVVGSIDNTEPLVIGARNNHTFNMQGEIAEIVIYDHDLDAAERDEVVAYLDRKWFEPAPPPSTHYGELLGTDLEADVAGVATSVLVRIPFELDGDPAAFDELTLDVRYDDGFVAYLNGAEVARRGAPDGEPTWSSSAPQARPDTEALRVEEIDISASLPLLAPGSNVLALHALNHAVDDDDLLILPALRATGISESEGYFPVPTPGLPNGPGVAGVLDPPRFATERGVFHEPLRVEILPPSSESLVLYTVDGSRPTLENGIEYVEAVSIEASTVLRAAAWLEDHLPSAVETHSYIFPEDALSQTGAGFPGSHDYAMDPDVVDHARFGPLLMESLLSLPAVSIAVDADADMFGRNGIYSNPTRHGDEWERPVSIELIAPGGEEAGFQADCGIRIHGGAARERPKKSFRLYFRRQYGQGRLEYPLFVGSPVSSFDQIVLRGGYNDTWNIGNTSLESQYMRDQVARLSQLESGRPGSRFRYVHLWIDGLYWGLYDVSERIHETFAAEHLGGDEEGWDVIKHRQDGSGAEVLDGDRLAWDEAMDLANSGLSSASAYERLRAMVDPVSLADYMVLNFFCGSTDWPHRNWYAIRPRQEGGRFQFLAWDTERAMRVPQLTINRTGVDQNDTTARLYSRLRSNAEFRVLFGDRAHRWLTGDGVLTPGRAIERYERIAVRIEDAIVAESARWGDSSHPTLVTPDAWQAEREELERVYFPRRTGIVLDQLRSIGLYPRLDAPDLGLPAGAVEPDSSLTFEAAAGVVYFTIDGSDPRESGGGIAPGAQRVGAGGVDTLLLDRTTRVRARALDDGAWSAVEERTYVVETGALRVTEIMYQPPPPAPESPFEDEEFEFLELQNTGTTPIGLDGVRIVGGVEFLFGTADSAPLDLEAGEVVLVVENLEAFASRYGTEGLRIEGEYSGRLANGGERIRVEDGVGREILDFTYDDGWHPGSDGNGASLEIVDPGADPRLWGQPVAWRESARAGGSPGSVSTSEVGGLQRPGDINQDGGLDISDAIGLLGHLFLGSPSVLPCEGGNLAGAGNRMLLDASGDGDVNLTDAVHVLVYLFRGGEAPSLGSGCVPISGCPDTCSP